jgi:hypothetical protein
MITDLRTLDEGPAFLIDLLARRRHAIQAVFAFRDRVDMTEVTTDATRRVATRFPVAAAQPPWASRVVGPRGCRQESDDPQ